MAIIILNLEIARAPIFVFFPMLAFFDWGAYNLRNMQFSKHISFISGIFLGMAVPIFYLNILSLSWLFAISGIFYLLIFFMIFIMKFCPGTRNKLRSE